MTNTGNNLEIELMVSGTELTSRLYDILLQYQEYIYIQVISSRHRS